VYFKKNEAYVNVSLPPVQNTKVHIIIGFTSFIVKYNVLGISYVSPFYIFAQNMNLKEQSSYDIFVVILILYIFNFIEQNY